ncbi:MAG: 16S rRNA (cytosine(1402)-N(4))-methyltransferase RsmH [Sphingobacteriales bacterium]|jgi:16S rRNA (cytosine1402-N4)-methyltransferase|nr:16S rRNA (cytosine(1402)-N(4))-methyltransferase RsmH [Sphingobacteriales bacterium]
MTSYHQPVMLNECLEGLNIQKNGIYVDVTFGGGGHSNAILEQLGPEGKLIGFDQDPDARKNIPNDDRFIFLDQNFQFLKNQLRFLGIQKVDGILADLGVSSHQFDAADRGFSIRFDATLDMRMDQSREKDAKYILNHYAEEDLHKIFGMYGEVHNARSLAALISKARVIQPIETVTSFKELIRPMVKRGKENQYYAQVFQALRIEVNEELEVLKDFLVQSAEVLKPGGRLVVMSYHSLEDRLVKNFIQKGKFSGEVEKDLYGNSFTPLKAITRKTVVATEEEVKINNRARSAKLRIAEKVDE